MSAQVIPLPISHDDDVRRAQSGDADAFDRLYEAHVGRIYALCLRMSGSRPDAEQLTQDVFVRMWQRLPSFRGGSAFSTWLYRLAVNAVTESWRKTRRYEMRVTPAVDSDDVDIRSIDTESRIELEGAINALPERARLVLVLHDIEGFKHEEIADMCGIAVGTTKAQLHRARSLLKESLTR